jgi:hypothetical protein
MRESLSNNLEQPSADRADALVCAKHTQNELDLADFVRDVHQQLSSKFTQEAEKCCVICSPFF